MVQAQASDVQRFGSRENWKKLMFGLDSGKKRWLFVFAHMDDETILAYGTASKIASYGNEV